MPSNLGIDFGSTNTTISYYGQNGLQGLLIDGGKNPSVPTLAARHKKMDKFIKFENQALDLIGNAQFQTYSAFKMLLAETNEDVIKKNGYTITGPTSPYGVSKIYLSHAVEQAKAILEDQSIGNIYVGVPEIWFQKLSTADGCKKVRDIFREILGIHIEDPADRQRVCIVSEPIAATAYFAYNYQNLNKKHEPYNGNVLLIDYGGGTLDVTLTHVQPSNEDPNKSMISVLLRTGSGEGNGETIGKAGIAYMHNVVKRAMQDEGKDVNMTDTDFRKMVVELERSLISEKGKLDRVFDLEITLGYSKNKGKLIGMVDPDLEFTTLYTDYDELTITYKQLVDVYNETIAGVLKDAIEEIEDKMKRKKIPFRYEELEKSHMQMKVIEVGGFGNYILVKKQIDRMFSDLGEIQRNEFVIQGKDGTENAVSYGAALLANGLVKLQNTTNVSIGVWVDDPFPGTPHVKYAFQQDDFIEYDQPVPLLDSNGDVIPFGVAGGVKWLFYSESNDYYGYKILLQDNLQKELMEKIHDKDHPYPLMHIAMSIDSSNIYRIYFYPALENISKEKALAQGFSVELDSISKMKETERRSEEELIWGGKENV